MRRLLCTFTLAVGLVIGVRETALANPASAPGAGDQGDVANQAAGEDVALPAILNTSPRPTTCPGSPGSRASGT